MTKQKNMTKAERNELLEKKVAQLETAVRLSQMMIQQCGNVLNKTSQSVDQLTTFQRDIQYRFLAMRKLANLDEALVEQTAEALQVQDFNEASEKEDLATNAVVADVVTEDSTIILTTSVVGGRGGILRSRLKVADLGFPAFREQIVGKRVGESVEADLQGTTHRVTILGVRHVPNLATVPTVVETTGVESAAQ